MMLSPIVEGLSDDLQQAAAVGGEEIRRAAGLLTAALAPSVRIRLLEALELATAELTASFPDVTVELRLRDGDPVLTLVAAESTALPLISAQRALDSQPEGPAVADAVGVGEVEAARITLRVPEDLKRQIEAAARRAGVSINTWLVEAAARAVGSPTVPFGRERRNGPKRVTGFVRG